MVPQLAMGISPKLDGAKSVLRLETRTPPKHDAGEYAAILAQVEVPSCQVACELGGHERDVEGTNDETHPQMDLENNESRQLSA